MAEKKFSELFAFDLDGTLVHNLPDGTRGVPSYLIDTVSRLSKKSHIVVATGRRYRSALPDILSLPKMKYAVLNNGLVIKDFKGKTLQRRELSKSQAMKIGSFLSNRKMNYFFVADGYQEKIDFIFLKKSLETSESLQSVYDRTKGLNRVLGSLSDLSTFRGAPLIQIAAVEDYERLRRMQKSITGLLPKPYRAIVVKNIGVATFGALEVFPKTTSKWTGVNYVRKLLNAKRVIAAGDDENDIEMLKSAHIGLVMNHAEPHVKKASRNHINGPEGLAAYLKDFWIL